MRFQLDHDYHIHSQLSLCSNDPQQNTDHILRIAENLGLRQICLAILDAWRLERKSDIYTWEQYLQESIAYQG
jgi:hypothetical protein